MKKTSYTILAAVIILTVSFCGCGVSKKTSAGYIVVYADISLYGKLQDISKEFTAKYKEKVDFQFDSSSKLANEMLSGAHADLLILSGESLNEKLYNAKTIDDYELFVFKTNDQKVYSISKPYISDKYYYAQLFAETILSQQTKIIQSPNPNL